MDESEIVWEIVRQMDPDNWDPFDAEPSPAPDDDEIGWDPDERQTFDDWGDIEGTRKAA